MAGRERDITALLGELGLQPDTLQRYAATFEDEDFTDPALLLADTPPPPPPPQPLPQPLPVRRAAVPRVPWASATGALGTYIQGPPH